MAWRRCAWWSLAPIRASTAVRMCLLLNPDPRLSPPCAQACATTAPRTRCALPPPPPSPPPSPRPPATQVRPATVCPARPQLLSCLTRASRAPMQASTPPNQIWCLRPSPLCCCSLAPSLLRSSARPEAALRRLLRWRKRRGCCRSGCARNGPSRRRGFRCGNPFPISGAQGGRARGGTEVRARARRCGRLRARMPRHRRPPLRSASPARRRRCRRCR